MLLPCLSFPLHCPLHRPPVCVAHVCLSCFRHMNSYHCCFLLLCPFVFIVSAVPAAAQSWLHTPARLTDRFVVSSPISYSQIVYVTWSDLMLIWVILNSPASFSVIRRLRSEKYCKKDTGRMQWRSVWLRFFFSFLVVTRLIARLTLISGCVFMCLFAKARPRGLCGLWLFWRPKSEAQQKPRWPSVTQRSPLLIPGCSHALDSVKTGTSKGGVSGFMSSISHKENGLKTREKMSDSMCFVEATWTWRVLVVLMVWNNVRNGSHGATARCIMQHSFESHSSFFSICSHFLP